MSRKWKRAEIRAFNQEMREEKRKRDAEARMCKKCNSKKELLICGNEHGFAWCPCRDRICPTCGGFESVRPAGITSRRVKRHNVPTAAELAEARAAVPECETTRPRLEIPSTVAERRQLQRDAELTRQIIERMGLNV